MGYRRHYAMVISNKGKIIKERSNNDGDNGHAEMRTLKDLDKKFTVGGTIVIVRQVMGQDGCVKGSMSKPCHLCMKRIINSGVKKIVYSTGNNEKPWDMMKL